jgi:hypothetical protein
MCLGHICLCRFGCVFGNGQLWSQGCAKSPQDPGFRFYSGKRSHLKSDFDLKKGDPQGFGVLTNVQEFLWDIFPDVGSDVQLWS